jgi:prolyl-tRNA synthetase
VAKKAVLTPQAEDFPAWYQDVVARAELAEGGPVRGTMVIRPWGYAIWELMQADMDRRIKATGVQNAYFPLFIPMSFLEKEAEHVEGFAPELAVVTHGGGEQLAEPLVVRPTSETVINHLFAKWIQSHRDLPLLINQWANVVRWELRPRLFLRTTEFLWQEGHTAHATYEEAQAETMQMLEVYRSYMEDTLAIAVAVGEKSPKERFAGADRTYTCEGMMRDGKALQMGTSHNLGHNFAKAFDITYTDTEGKLQPVATTSWGSSTRMLGAVIMAHGVRVHTDQRFHLSFGRRAVDWELKGVPVRVELGPRELAEGRATVVRRDTREKSPVALESVAGTASGLLDEIQRALHAESLAFREARTSTVTDLAELRERLPGGGFFRVPWDGSEEAELGLGEGGASIRCIVEGDPPGPVDLITGKPAVHAVLVGRAY